MYAFMALLAATVQTGVVAAARKVEKVRTRRTVQKARPQTCVDLAGQIAASGTVRPSEIYARAVPGANGTLTAPFSGAECVWYVVRASERFWAYGPGPYGPQKVERSIKAADHVSGPLAIVDDTGSAHVDPTGAEFLLGPPAFSGFDAREGGDGRLYTRMSELLGKPPRIRHRRMTVGFLVEEWIVTADEELRIVGRARGLGGVHGSGGSGETDGDTGGDTGGDGDGDGDFESDSDGADGRGGPDGAGVVLGKNGRRPLVIAKRAATAVPRTY